MAVTEPQKHPLEHKSFSKPQETRSFEKGRIELITVGGVTFGRATFEPGWKWSTHVKPIAGTETCQAAHLAYQVSGRLHIEMEDGTEFDTVAGEVVNVPPGHDAWVLGNETVVMIDITGMEQYAKEEKAA